MSAYTYTLVVEEGPLQGRRFLVTSAGLKLGRSSQSEIAIPDPLLSRSHCQFELRGDAVWITDLASANQTLLNEKAVDSQPLEPGDRIRVGESLLRFERVEAAPADVGEAVVAPAGDVVIDLGFSREEMSASQTRRALLRPVIWSLAAILALVIGTTLILDPSRRDPAGAQVAPLAREEDRALLIFYEKVEASLDNLFRYEMSLSPDGILAVKIDDLSGRNRHVREEKKVDQKLLAELARDIEASGFFSLDRTYSGFAADPNTLNEWLITVVIGKTAHTSRVTNRAEPDAFRALRERLETFSKNELGIWAIQFSSERLTELALNALAVSRKKYSEREVRYGNLADAIRSYQEALFYLDTVNPKPDFYVEIIEEFETAQAELDRRYEEQRFRADRAINLSDWPTAVRELRILCEMIPDRADPRHKEAARKLLDVETRIRKSRR